MIPGLLRGSPAIPNNQLNLVLDLNIRRKDRVQLQLGVKDMDASAKRIYEAALGTPEGDFGNENVELVQSVANLEFTKAVILGNHDTWFTPRFSSKRKDRVQLQLGVKDMDASAKRIYEAALGTPEGHLKRIEPEWAISVLTGI
ncbi:hypothetical protein CJ030_MR0G018439 [Morella rubra]|uniref:Uncharacterized protein n=1 Tax=Morella rubra TaxID=262757 RepID=A0A6A1UHU7_9ROSI|nr:hypothetical protein CJ030_MR0G018439 [Morella rubra]